MCFCVTGQQKQPRRDRAFGETAAKPLDHGWDVQDEPEELGVAGAHWVRVGRMPVPLRNTFLDDHHRINVNHEELTGEFAAWLA